MYLLVRVTATRSLPLLSFRSVVIQVVVGVYVYMYICMYVRYLVVLSAALSQSFVYRVVLAGKNHRYVLIYCNVLQFQPIFASCVSRRHFSCVGLVFVAIFSCFGVSFVRSYLPMVRSRD